MDRSLKAIANSFEQLGRLYYSEADVSGFLVRPLIAATKLPIRSSNTLEWGESKSLLDHCLGGILPNATAHLIWTPPGLPLKYHPARILLAADPTGQASDWSVFVCGVDGARPGRVQVRTTTTTFDGEIWRCLNRLSARVAISIQDHETKCVHNDLIRRALRDLLENRDYDSIRGLTVKLPPSSAYEEVSDAMFGVAWDLLQSICEQPYQVAGPGVWTFPAAHAQALSRRLRAYKYASAFLSAPYLAHLNRLKVAIADWMSADIESASKTARSFNSLRSIYQEWCWLAAREVKKIAIGNGFAKFTDVSIHEIVSSLRYGHAARIHCGTSAKPISKRSKQLTAFFVERGLGQIASRLWLECELNTSELNSHCSARGAQRCLVP